MRLDDVLGDGEPEAGAARGARAIDLVEALEDALEIVRWEAGAGVFDADTEPLGVAPRAALGGAQKRSGCDGVALELGLAGLDARQLEQLLDELGEAVHLDVHLGEKLARGGGILERALLERLDERLERRK